MESVGLRGSNSHSALTHWQLADELSLELAVTKNQDPSVRERTDVTSPLRRRLSMATLSLNLSKRHDRSGRVQTRLRHLRSRRGRHSIVCAGLTTAPPAKVVFIVARCEYRQRWVGGLEAVCGP